MVGDIEMTNTGINPASPSVPVPGKLGSSLELQSDPMGVDFKPYLIRVLSSVKRNWLAVVPESARLGRRGKVVVQFAISKDGSVPKLVIAMPSGAEALDRAAVAGISASNPFPPLPAEFRGSVIRLQLNFMYNLQ
jgi:TonB family protein